LDNALSTQIADISCEDEGLFEDPHSVIKFTQVRSRRAYACQMAALGAPIPKASRCD
jgi:hypothetical protein